MIRLLNMLLGAYFKPKKVKKKTDTTEEFIKQIAEFNLPATVGCSNAYIGYFIKQMA